LLIGADAVGTETLKNLVLPGIGKFTIIDNAKVTQRDLGHDFFVSEEDIGLDKCEVVCKMMVEMNPDVKGAWIVSSVADFINSQAE
jgi:amyloid beta precursor protein binding protein 1